MSARWLRSLRAKLIGVVLLTTFVALGVALGSMVVYDLRAYHHASINDMNTQAELLGQTIAPALLFDDPRLARENLGLLRLRRQVHVAAVYDPTGAVFASYAAPGGTSKMPTLPENESADIVGRDLVVFKRIVVKGEVVGTVYLRADYELYDRVIDYARIAAAVAIAAMLVALVLSWWLQKIVTGPILAISTVAREVVEQRDYTRRAQKLSDDEVGALVESFNRMMAEVEGHAQENSASLREIAVEVQERRAAQQEVMRLNDELEQRVRDRTAQLESSNTELALATERAEKANRAKSDFLSNMSHELRTPLNAILGFGHLMSSPTRVVPEAKRLEYTQHIVKAGRHLLQLINEVLDLARIESANLMLSLEPVGLAEILQECEALIEPAARQRGIRMVFPNEPHLTVVADRTRLKQVLLNLLSNAIKYNRNHGSVIVDCVALGRERVRISVQDTGNGLRPDQLASLFQPFNRLGQESSTVEGTGIGLVVTKRLVELMGGHIEVASTPGVGSVFSIELKAAEESMLAGKPAVASGFTPLPSGVEASASSLLLHVEDNPANLQLVQEIIGLRGDLRQMSAPDAQLGIELARAHEPRVILMDVNLPGLSGQDALAILREDGRTAHIPVIALTANAMPRDVAQGMAAGFFLYLTKPVDVDQLNEAIDRALEIRGKAAKRDRRI